MATVAGVDHTASVHRDVPFEHPLPSEGSEASTVETATEWPLLQVKTTLLACTAMHPQANSEAQKCIQSIRKGVSVSER